MRFVNICHAIYEVAQVCFLLWRAAVLQQVVREQAHGITHASVVSVFKALEDTALVLAGPGLL